VTVKKSTNNQNTTGLSDANAAIRAFSKKKNGKKTKNGSKDGSKKH